MGDQLHDPARYIVLLPMFSFSRAKRTRQVFSYLITPVLVFWLGRFSQRCFDHVMIGSFLSTCVEYLGGSVSTQEFLPCVAQVLSSLGGPSMLSTFPQLPVNSNSIESCLKDSEYSAFWCIYSVLLQKVNSVIQKSTKNGNSYFSWNSLCFYH